MSTVALVAPWLVPLLGAGIALLVPARLALRLLPLLAIPALVAAACGWISGVTVSVEVSDLFLGASFTFDPLLGPIATIWALAGWFATPYLARGNHRRRFAAGFALSMAGNFGLLLAADAIGFSAFYALLSFAGYLLVVHDGSRFARQAAKVYLVLVIVGELLILPGILLAAADSPSFALADLRASLASPNGSVTAIVLLLLGFSIKAGVAPLHVWLALAHPAAPAPASAVLSGCLIKAGLLGWMRFLPLGERALPEIGTVVTLVAAFGLVGALLAALLQTTPKTLLAYSSIAKMSTITLVLGAALISPAGWSIAGPAVLLYAIFHALAKSLLFLGTAVTPGATGSWALPARVGLLASGLAFVGLPWLPGAIAKKAHEAALVALDVPSWITHVLTVGGVLTVLVVVRFVLLTWPGRQGAGAQPIAGAQPTAGAQPIAEAPPIEARVVWVAALAALLAFPFWTRVVGLDTHGGYELAALLSGWGPLLLAAPLAVIAISKGWRIPFEVPPGDLLIGYVAALRWLRARIPSAVLRFFGRPTGAALHFGDLPERLAALDRWSERFEDSLLEGATAIFLFVGLVLVFALVSSGAGG